eukprot:c17850_g1_i2 orf=3-383(-)
MCKRPHRASSQTADPSCSFSSSSSSSTTTTCDEILSYAAGVLMLDEIILEIAESKHQSPDQNAQQNLLSRALATGSTETEEGVCVYTESPQSDACNRFNRDRGGCMSLCVYSVCLCLGAGGDSVYTH